MDWNELTPIQQFTIARMFPVSREGAIRMELRHRAEEIIATLDDEVLLWLITPAGEAALEAIKQQRRKPRGRPPKHPRTIPDDSAPDSLDRDGDRPAVGPDDDPVLPGEVADEPEEAQPT